MSPRIEYRLSEASLNRHVQPEEEGIVVGFSAVQSQSGSPAEVLDTSSSSVYSTFKSNYECWNAENALSAVSNVNNVYFKQIVSLGRAAVPYIYKELQKGPTDLVYALDAIFEFPIKYDGFVPLKESCDLWLSILKKIGVH